MPSPTHDGSLDARTTAALVAAADTGGTPSYGYFVDRAIERIGDVRAAFGGRFEVSFAIKSNPNIELLRALLGSVDTLDASSGGEVLRAVEAGCRGSHITFSGPAKREFELQQALASDCGLVVCESYVEMVRLDQLARAAGRVLPVAIRINPRTAPKKFGVNMAGKPSQFGIDEEDLPGLASSITALPGLSLKGFHIYSGTNSLSEEAIAENFGIFHGLFERFAEVFSITPEVLIFGSGFGIPYHPDQTPLDVQRIGVLAQPMLALIRQHPRLGAARLVLEMGRYLVGPVGFFLTRVVAIKRSRGVDICMCDGGFNNHLAAFGLMGTVIRRNWSMWNITSQRPGVRRKYTLVGPLCTTIDTLAQDVELDDVAVGDIIAVGASGAYGPTASPAHFISHPPARELLIRESSGLDVRDVSEMQSWTPAGSGAVHA